MGNGPRWCVWVALAVGLAGCESATPVAPQNAGGGAPPANAGAAPSAHAGPGMHGAPAGQAVAGNPSGGSPGVAAKDAPPTQPEDLIQYLPPSLTVATGARMGELASANGEARRFLSNQWLPVISILTRAGIAPEDISYLWAGSSRGTSDDLLICVRTSKRIDEVSLVAGLRAAPKGDKVGRALVYPLADLVGRKNAVAVLDAYTVLLGRDATLRAGLQNPAEGAVRHGLASINVSRALFWIAGQDTGARQNARFGIPGIGGAGLDQKALRSTGVAVGFFAAGESGAATGTMPNPGLGHTAMPAAPAHAGPTATPASPPMHSPPAHSAAMPASPMGAHSATLPGQTSSATESVSVVVGLSYESETAARVAEEKIRAAQAELSRLIGMLNQIALATGQGTQPGQPGAPGGMPPAGGPGHAGPGPAGPGPAGPGHAGPGPSGPGTGPGASNEADESAIPETIRPILGPASIVSAFQVSRENSNVRLAASINADLLQRHFSELGDPLKAMGATAVGDGLFAGTLTSLAEGLKSWPVAKPDRFKGVNRIGDLPIRAGYSWMTDMLPYLGREDLYLKFDLAASWGETKNIMHTRVVIPAFLNPLDSETAWRGYPFDGMGLTHFVGMSGVEDRRNVTAATLPRSDPRAGIFGYDAIAQPDEITDGQSHTIMLISSGRVAGPWVQGGGATIRGARAPYFHPLTGFGATGLGKPGAFVLMADGSTRLINGDIDPEVFKAMCTMHGAETFDLPQAVTRSD